MKTSSKLVKLLKQRKLPKLTFDERMMVEAALAKDDEARNNKCLRRLLEATCILYRTSTAQEMDEELYTLSCLLAVPMDRQAVVRPAVH